MFPLTSLANALLHFSALRGPPAAAEEEVVAGLALSAVTPPTLVYVDLLYPGEASPNGGVAGEELVEATSQLLPFFSEVWADFYSPQGTMLALSLNVLGGAILCSPGSFLRCLSN